MGKPADGRGNTGSTDGIRTGGDAGNERHACKANPATTDGIGTVSYTHLTLPTKRIV